MIMQIGKKFCSSEVGEIMARKRNEKKVKNCSCSHNRNVI